MFDVEKYNNKKKKEEKSTTITLVVIDKSRKLFVHQHGIHI